MPVGPDPLPIDDVLGEVCAALQERGRAVLVAPPGAGKTTRVPLALLDQAFARDGRILVLEPRRVAARAAAARMAAMLGEEVGQTVGLRVRMQSLVSGRTRVEIITEGVFTRMILDDPALEGVCAVLFDEFHERSLDADLGLALALDARAGLRDDLRLLVMSATLEGARVGALLGGAQLIESLGRAFTVETRYVGRDPGLRLEQDVVRVVARALGEESGSLLVFLPGQGEITRVARMLAERIASANVDITPLFGAMDRAAQDRAVAPTPPGRRKVVLATSIAETSLTIEGVRVVIDSGLSRVPRYEPDIGLTRLETRRAARSNVDQRRGRAGRTEPGVCYRLWEEAANRGLEAYAAPEILSADLSGLLLDCASWGVSDPARLAFLDPPPAPALAEARALLASIGALDEDGRITGEGKFLARLALPLRLAHMVVGAARAGQGVMAARLAVLLGERGLGGEGVDVAGRLERFVADRSPRASEARRLAEGLARRAGAATGGAAMSVGAMLARAFPDRIARARGAPGEFLMVNGRAGALEPHDPLAREPWLAIGEIAGRAAGARIVAAAALRLDEIEAIAGARIATHDETIFDAGSLTLRRRRRRRLGALVVDEQTLAAAGDEQSARTLAAGLLALDPARWPWSKPLSQWRDRAMFLRRASAADWPDLSDAALAASTDWLAPYLVGKTKVAEIANGDFAIALEGLLPYALRRRVDEEAPTHFVAPTGSAVAIDYGAEGGPGIALRVQELFGLRTHPTLAGGRAPLTLHLLSPAHRPIQITRDLPGFWRGSWASVRADLRGRYPRHFWPEDPATALPTNRAKPRGT